MYARVQTFHQPAEKLDELTTLTREQLTASPPAGLSGCYFLVDRENEKALLISLWDSKADLRELEATNAATRAHLKAEAGLEPPAAEIFEVVLQRP